EAVLVSMTRASDPPARDTNRLRMTRSRTLSSAPPMMMTVPSVTDLQPRERVSGRIPAVRFGGRGSPTNDHPPPGEAVYTSRSASAARTARTLTLVRARATGSDALDVT